MRRIIASTASVLAVAALVVGAPAILVVLAGNPFPSWDRLTEALSSPDYGGRFFLGTVLPLVGWVAWAFFTLPFLAAIPDAVRHVRHGATARRAPAVFRVQQAAAAALVSAVVVLLGAVSAPASSAGAASAPAVAAATDAVAAPSTSSRSLSTPSMTGSVAVAAVSAGQRPSSLEFHQRVIVSGDTLWDIAAEELGAGQRYPEIFDASTRIVQPDGRRLADPDLILPGWTVHIPGPGAPTERTAPVQNPAPAEPTVPLPADETIEPFPAELDEQSLLGVDRADPTAEPTQDSAYVADSGTDLEGDELAGVVRTAGGISGVLAAGLLAVLAALRLHQRHRRRAGQRLQLPDEQASHLERQLRDAGDDAGSADVDRAVRAIAAWASRTGTPLPGLYAVRLAAAGPAFFFADPVQLPAPFEPASDDDLVWTYPPNAEDHARAAVNPYPSLLLLGQDPAGAHILIDLEHWRALHVHGGTSLIEAVLTAMTLELATTPWADDLHLTVVGGHSGLADALDAGRIRYIDTIETLLPMLRAELSDIGQALERAGYASVTQARLDESPETWPTQIVIVHSGLDDQHAHTLADLIAHSRNAGIAVIATHPLLEGARLRLRDEEHASLDPVGLDLCLQQVSAEVLTVLNRLMDAATAPSLRPDVTAAVTSLPSPSGHDHAAEPGAPATEVTVPSQEAGIGTAAPYLRLLGPVSLDLPDAGTPRQAAPGRGVELVAYLHLHPHASTGQFASAFWPNAAPQAASMSMRKLTNHTRNWLGATDTDPPRSYLPRYEPAEGYRLDLGIRSDWSDFQDLVGTDLTVAGSDDLLAALRLVRGQPFTGIKQRFWAWCHLDMEEMIARISDVADELFGRAYAARDHARAQFAATVGNVVDPVNEIAWRNLMLSALAKGDVDRFERIVADLERYLDSFDEGYEPEPETQALIDEGRRELVADP
ncbi:hypothetical protein [Microbacterium sp. No. 7]|uniref:hypothetical protein n=1 Tax=Microbacterium sp. No. 7 TaxID=1714373 RepID=UPI0006CF4DDF|nr:hypothetical protein [Microbacterium sp. No. 7]